MGTILMDIYKGRIVLWKTSLKFIMDNMQFILCNMNSLQYFNNNSFSTYTTSITSMWWNNLLLRPLAHICHTIYMNLKYLSVCHKLQWVSICCCLIYEQNQHICVVHNIGKGNIIAVWGFDFLNYIFVKSLGIVTKF